MLQGVIFKNVVRNHFLKYL